MDLLNAITEHDVRRAQLYLLRLHLPKGLAMIVVSSKQRFHSLRAIVARIRHDKIFKAQHQQFRLSGKAQRGSENGEKKLVHHDDTGTGIDNRQIGRDGTIIFGENIMAVVMANRSFGKTHQLNPQVGREQLGTEFDVSHTAICECDDDSDSDTASDTDSDTRGMDISQPPEGEQDCTKLTFINALPGG